jgi:hypothetical protein
MHRRYVRDNCAKSRMCSRFIPSGAIKSDCILSRVINESSIAWARAIKGIIWKEFSKFSRRALAFVSAFPATSVTSSASNLFNDRYKNCHCLPRLSKKSSQRDSQSSAWPSAWPSAWTWATILRLILGVSSRASCRIAGFSERGKTDA